jgi:hypothetical protein
MISQEKSFDRVAAWLDHPFGSYLLSGKFAGWISLKSWSIVTANLSIFF